jgi:hypothetical protein
MKKFDVWHLAILLAAPAATAFLDYEANSAAPFSKSTLQHAGLATALVVVALLKQFVQPPPPPGAP